MVEKPQSYDWNYQPFFFQLKAMTVWRCLENHWNMHWSVVSFAPTFLDIINLTASFTSPTTNLRYYIVALFQFPVIPRNPDMIWMLNPLLIRWFSHSNLHWIEDFPLPATKKPRYLPISHRRSPKATLRSSSSLSFFSRYWAWHIHAFHCPTCTISHGFTFLFLFFLGQQL